MSRFTLDGKPACNRKQGIPTSFRCPFGRQELPFLSLRRVRPPELLSASPVSASLLRGCRAARLLPSGCPPYQDWFSAYITECGEGIPAPYGNAPKLSATSNGKASPPSDD